MARLASGPRIARDRPSGLAEDTPYMAARDICVGDDCSGRCWRGPAPGGGLRPLSLSPPRDEAHLQMRMQWRMQTQWQTQWPLQFHLQFHLRFPLPDRKTGPPPHVALRPQALNARSAPVSPIARPARDAGTMTHDAWPCPFVEPRPGHRDVQQPATPWPHLPSLPPSAAICGRTTVLRASNNRYELRMESLFCPTCPTCPCVPCVLAEWRSVSRAVIYSVSGQTIRVPTRQARPFLHNPV
jgi:hypothetical protein